MSRGTSGAALAVALLLTGIALPGPGDSSRVGCPTPRELLQRDGQTIAVGCGEEPALRARTFPPVRGPARIVLGIPLDLATVDARTLEALPGVGPALAAAIVRERDVKPFAAPWELTRVPGLGRRTAARLAPWFEGTPP